MAIDPTAPLTPIPPAASAGSQPNSVVLQAMARAALANVTNTLGELVGQPAAEASKSRQGVGPSVQASPEEAGRAAVSSSSGGGVSSVSPPKSPPPETRLMRAVRIAATEAVPRQAGLAPLMADIQAVLERPETPEDVRGAGEALLARLPRAFEMSTARGLRKAMERSGVFLEARLAKSSPAMQDGAAQTLAVDTDLKAALLVFKGTLSTWLAHSEPPSIEAARPPTQEAPKAEIEADRTPATSMAKAEAPATSSPLPESADVEATEASPSPLVPSSDGADRKAVVAGATKAPPDSASSELEDASLSAKAPPVTALEEEAVEPRFAVFLAPSRPTAPLAAKPQIPALGLLGLVEASPSDQDVQTPTRLSDAPLAVRGYGAVAADSEKPKTPPPPFAGGPMAGQRPAISDVPPQAAAEEIVRRLLKGANGALARQDLMQIASLREAHHDPETGEARPQPARLNLDVPFVTPQGVAVAQFEITKDGGGTGGAVAGPVERTYRARFSIDVEPLGPVHALVTLTGSRARVSLWAERAETIVRLRAGEEALGAALREAELKPEVAVHSGPPPVKDASPLGHFVDQAS